ncbi:restriction endonuclease subunit S [Thermomonas brevis]
MKRVALGSIAEVIAGQSPEGKFYNTTGHGLPFYQGKKDFGEKFIESATVWTKQITKLAKAGDILMSVRAPVGPVNFATQDICIGRGLAAIRGKNGIDRDFLFYQLLHLQPEIAGNEGAVFASINKAQIEALPVVAPMHDEQKRIVAILDEAFAGIATAKANAEKCLQDVHDVFDHELQAAFSHVEGGWHEVELGSLLSEQPRNGWSPPAANHAERGVPVLTLSSVTGFKFRPDKIKFTSAHTDAGRHYWVRNGDLLITRSNTPELVGHVAIASGIYQPTIYPDLVMRMRVDPDKADTRFLHYQLQSSALREVIRSRARGASSTMKKIDKEAVQTLPIHAPTVTQQREVVLKLDCMAYQTQHLQSIYTRKLAALDELKQSLLQQAFSGAL